MVYLSKTRFLYPFLKNVQKCPVRFFQCKNLMVTKIFIRFVIISYKMVRLFDFYMFLQKSTVQIRKWTFQKCPKCNIEKLFYFYY